MSGYVRYEVVCGRNVEIYEADGEEFVAIVEDFPNLDIRASTLAELYDEIEIAVSVEHELDKLWNSEGIPVDEDEYLDD